MTLISGLSVRLIEGVHLIGGPLNRGFTVLKTIHPVMGRRRIPRSPT